VVLPAACVGTAGETAAATSFVRLARSTSEQAAEPILGVAGVAATSRSVLVLDLARPGLTVLDPNDLRALAVRGVEGRGPGEFQAAFNPHRDARWTWLAATGDSVVAFDGNRLGRFGAEGQFQGLWQDQPHLPEGLTDFTSRIVVTGTTLWYDNGDYAEPRRADQRVPYLTVRRWDGRHLDTAFSLELTQPPRGPRGSFVGTGQAVPLWDVSPEGCVVASNGGDLDLWFVAGGGMAAVRSLPTDVADAIPFAEELATPVVAGMRRVPDPSRRKRWAAVRFDGEGNVWLLSAAFSRVREGRVVVRYHPGADAAEIDTVPAWPRAFASGRGWYGVFANDDGTFRVERWQAAAH